jgi:hypothetical protein
VFERHACTELLQFCSRTCIRPNSI